MEISNKLLVEQAWALQVKLKRRFERSCRGYGNGRVIISPSSDGNERGNAVHLRAYSRYMRRLKRLWV